ncbi:uncharacterized protein PRCAT00000994001 [Priceomyces carsonii]|uniref:uncharacterized protein n=1 Tax=Priceomyces carsonii TaxID=28549 RepID=UPI002ED95E91|nr:unnamed protein product [Priceomyces carsonii]
MASALYILHWPEIEVEFLQSQVLVFRSYRNSKIDHKTVIQDFDEAYKRQNAQDRTPFILIRNISYVYIKVENDLFLLTVSTKNFNAMLQVVFLRNFYEVVTKYLCNTSKEPDTSVSKLNKDTIMDNFNLVFELLDECMDFGMIQLTDFNILKEFIKIGSAKPRMALKNNKYDSEDSESEGSEKGEHENSSFVDIQKKKSKVKSTKNRAVTSIAVSQNQTHVNSAVLRTFSHSINWRPKGIFYSKNEIYMDMVEECEFYYDLEENIIRRNYITGKCVVKCFLSGMPICKIGFNEMNISGIKSDTLDELDFSENKILPEVDEEEDEGDMAYDEGDNKIVGTDTTSQINPKNRDRHVIDPEVKSDSTYEGPNTAEEHQRSNKNTSKNIPLENMKFHQCIELGKIYKNNIISFIPPDDEFVLMSYNVEQKKRKKLPPLFMVKPQYRIFKKSKKLQILCILNTNFKKRLECSKLVISMPLNPTLFNIETESGNYEVLKYKSELGDVSYKIDTSELIWSLEKVHGRKSIKMMAELHLADTENLNLSAIESYIYNKAMYEQKGTASDDTTEQLDRYYNVNGASSSLALRLREALILRTSVNEINICFSVPMLSYSGLKITYLSVNDEQMQYTCFSWVRYLTESESYQDNIEASSKDNRIHRGNYKFKLGVSCFLFVD